MARRRGFTLVETLASVAVVAIGVTAALGALGYIAKADAKSKLREEGQRLAIQKIDELLATGDYQVTPNGGDFSEYGKSDWSWSAVLKPSGTEYVDRLGVTVTHEGPGQYSKEINRLVFRGDQLVPSGGAQ